MHTKEQLKKMTYNELIECTNNWEPNGITPAGGEMFVLAVSEFNYILAVVYKRKVKLYFDLDHTPESVRDIVPFIFNECFEIERVELKSKFEGV